MSSLKLILVTTLCLISAGAFAHLKDLTWIKVEGWTPENISRIVALDHDAHAGEFLYVLSDYQTSAIEGKQCITGGLFVFDVDDNFAFNIDEDVTLELTFHKPSTESFIFSYDKVSEQTLLETYDIPTNQGHGSTWHTEVIKLERAAFANRIRAASDFMVGAKGSIYSGSLEITPETNITLCDVKILRTSTSVKPEVNASWSLEITDEQGQPTAARVGLYDMSGRSLPPADDALKITRLYGGDQRRVFSINKDNEHWPGSGRYIFYVDGKYSTELPAGEYQLAITKGFEYHFVDQKITIKPGENTTQIALKRWTDMPKQGWFSGDDHIHLGRDRSDNNKLSALIQAEDVHMGFMLQMGNIKQKFFEQYAFGKDGEYQQGNHALISGQENPRTGDLGHVIAMNTSQYHDGENYYLYADAANAVHADGGLWGYAHIAFGAGIGMQESMAHTVPFGHVDFVEQLQARYMNTELMYDFLNLGFEMTPIAGSDAPYINLVGTERFYVQTGEEHLDPKAFYKGIDEGRVFITSGPMLDLSVNGQGIGSTVNISSGETLNVTASASLNPDIDRLDRLELVVRGEVVAVAESREGAQKLTISHQLSPQESLWMSIRAFGKKARVSPVQHPVQAHSGIVYVLVDGDEFFGDRDQMAELTAKYKAMLDTLYHKRPQAVKQTERDHFDQDDVDESWDRSLSRMRQTIEDAHRIYDSRLKMYGRK